jgi:predicted permease
MISVREQTRYAWRALHRSPAFTLLTVGLLALGIGAAAAVYSAAIAVLVRDLPIRDQTRLVGVWTTDAGAAIEVSSSIARYERFRKATKTLSAVAGFAHYGSNLVPLRDADGAPLYARESLVTGNFFEVLGVRPVAGRLLRADDDVLGAPLSIVISEDLWRRAFGADPRAIGRRVRLLNRESDATIVGIAPSGLEFPAGAEYWLPIVPSKYPAVDMIGRLTPDASAEQVRSELWAFVENDTRAYPDDAGARSMRATGVAVHAFTDLIVGPVREPLVIFAAAVSALLLIACVNVGNLLLARATAREHEIGIRRALGARPADILVQLAAELAIIAAIGTLLGTAFAYALLRVLVSMAPAELPRAEQIALSPVAVLVAVAMTLVAVFAAGVLPPLFFGAKGSTLRVDVRTGTETRRRRSLRTTMVASQIALALVLLTLSGLLLRSLSRLENLGLGYTTEHLSIVGLTTRYTKYRSADAFYGAMDDAQRQMKAVPGVEAVSPVLAWPFLGTNVFAAQFDRRGDAPNNLPYVSWDAVGQEFFRAMSSPILRGRGITDADRRGTQPVAVVTQDLARLFWPGEDPIGKQLRFAGVTSDTSWTTVVGVIGPLHYRTLKQATPTVLFSYRQQFEQGIFVVRSTRELATLLPSLRRAAAASDRDVVLWRAESMDQVMAGPLARPRFEALLVTAFGMIALLLAAAGLYGVTSYLLHQRTREFAIRVALGATNENILRMAVGDALRTAALGTVLGIGIALLIARAIASQLFEVRSYDPLSICGAAALLLVVALLAAFIPARTAARVDSARILAR